MDHHMYLQSVIWDDVANTVTPTFVEATQTVPPPEGGEGWWPGPGSSVTTSPLPIKRAVITNPTGIRLTTDPATGLVMYTKLEYQNGDWVSLGRVNPDGSPYTG